MASISLGMRADQYRALSSTQKQTLLAQKRQEAVQQFGGTASDWKLSNPLGGEFGNRLTLENTSIASTAAQTPGVLASPLPDTQAPSGSQSWEIYNPTTGQVVGHTTDPEGVRAQIESQGLALRPQSQSPAPPTAGTPQINPDDPTEADEGFGPPVNPPPVVPPGVPIAPVVPVAPFEGDPTTFGRFTQFLNARGLGASGGGPAGAFGRGLFGQTQDLFDLQDKARGLFQDPEEFGPQLPAPSFAQFLATQGGQGTSGLRSGAANLLSRILGVGADERTARGFGFGNEFDAEGLQVTGADREGLSISDQNAFLGSGLRQQFGRLGGAHITGRLGTERDIFSQRQSQGTATAPSFLDFLRNKYGIR